MKHGQLGLVQRIVLSAAVPTVAILCLLPVQWAGRMGYVFNGKREEDIVYAIFLREQAWFWPAVVASVAVWLCVLWAPRRVRSDGVDSLSNSAQQPTSAPSGARG